jgi:hypothetical protein
MLRVYGSGMRYKGKCWICSEVNSARNFLEFGKVGRVYFSRVFGN